jgi:YidC/Oxa1 family membrane protein insertase
MVAAQFLSMKIPEIINKKRAEETAKKQHRKPADTTSSQAMTMQYSMLAMIAVFGLMWPTAMTVYWIINSLVNIGKTFIVQRVIEANK